MNTNRTDRKIALRILAEVTPGRSFAEAVRSAAWKGLVEARDLGWTEAECAALDRAHVYRCRTVKREFARIALSDISDIIEWAEEWRHGDTADLVKARQGSAARGW